MVSMSRPTKAALVGVEVIGVLILHAVTMFVAYGYGVTTILALSLPVACGLHVILFSQYLRPAASWISAVVLSLAGAYVGAFFAFNTYGT
jgi:hypothetical protein